MEHSGKFEIEILKIVRRGSRSLHSAEFCQLKLLVYRKLQRIAPRIITQPAQPCIALLLKPFV